MINSAESSQSPCEGSRTSTKEPKCEDGVPCEPAVTTRRQGAVCVSQTDRRCHLDASPSRRRGLPAEGPLCRCLLGRGAQVKVIPEGAPSLGGCALLGGKSPCRARPRLQSHLQEDRTQNRL